MKILIISNLYPSSGNAQDHLGKMLLHRYAQCWSKDHEIVVINPHSYNILTARKLRKKALMHSFKIDGITVYNIPILRLPGDKLQVRKFKNFVKNLGEFDFILGCLPVGIEISNFVSKSLNIPYFTYFHNTDYHRSGISKNRITRKYTRFIEQATGLMFVSPKLKKAFEKYSANKSILLTGGIDTSWISDHSKVTFGSGLNLVTSARLVRQKNIESVLVALNDLSVEFRLSIAGDGPHRSYLEQLINNHTNLKENVSLYGMVNFDQLKVLFDSSDFMILMSTNESFGLVYLEAMARGCIPIGTRGEGIDGIIVDEQNGYLCDPAPKSIGSLLEKISKTPNERLIEVSENALETAKNYVYERLAESFIAFARAKIM
ncbi:glycosyltransferase family 4 protein [Ekhidna sp.]|uniref:glycosyltransferase family 4 protein n=1 Tax=Ekhidna sp. TaxID=2608089 RepID=UPI003CCBF915